MQAKYYFYRLPAELAEKHGLIVAGVYAVLLNACTEGIYRADIKLETIAQKCNLSKRSVQYTIDQLEEIGLVRRVKDGRRTVYDVIAVLPPKQHKADYLPETEHLRGDTYEDLILRIPNAVRQEHFREQLRLLGHGIKETAYLSLRQIDAEAERKKRGIDWTEYVEEVGTANAINDALYGEFTNFEGVEENGKNK